MYENPSVLSLKDLSPSRRAAQMLMPRVDLADPDSVKLAEKLVRNFGIGGFIIFNGDIKSVRDLTLHLSDLSEIPLFFGCDVERGLGQRVSGATLFPFTMALGAINDESLARRQAEATAQEMRYCGLNLAFAPVLDVNSEQKNPIINVRSFSDDPKIVAKLGAVFGETLQKQGVIACAKHFPGHGATLEDSHAGAARVNRPLRELEQCDLLPFREVIAAKIHCMMPAHVSFPALDPSGLSATLSQKILRCILREQLGFEGVVVSDSFRMDAVGGESYEGENVMAAFVCGVDIVLDPRDPEVFLSRCASRQFFSGTECRESLGRILYAKKLFVADRQNETLPSFSANQELTQQISRRSACVLKGNPICQKKVSLVFFSTDENKEILFGLAEGLSQKGVSVERTFSFPQSLDVSADCALICVVSTGPAAWTENCSLPPQAVDYVNSLFSHLGEKFLLTFGSPYPADMFPFFDTMISFFDPSRQGGVTAAEVLCGEIKTVSKLPVIIKP